MASETVLSTPPEEVEKEEVKKMEAEKVCPPPKEPEEPSCPPAEAKVEEEKAAVIQDDDLKNTNADEEPTTEPVEQKAAVLPPPAEVAEPKVDDKPAELPPTLDEKKTEDSPIVDKGTPEVERETVLAPDTACIVDGPTIEKEGIKSEPAIVKEDVKSDQKPEDKPVELPPQPAELAESTEAKVDDKPIELPPTLDEKKTEDSPIVDKDTPPTCGVAVPTIEKEDIKSEPEKQDENTKEEKPKETEKVVVVPESSPAEVEQVQDKDGTVAEAESTPQEASVPIPVVEDKIPEKIGTESSEPVKVEVVSPADDVKDTIGGSDEAKSEAPTIQVEEKHVDCNPIEEVNDVTERTNDTIEVTGLSEEKRVELVNNETGVPEVKSVVAEELVPCEDAKATVEVTALSGEKGVELGKDETGVPEVKSVVAEESVPCEDAKDTVEVTGLSEEKGSEPVKNETGVAEEKSVVAEELVPCEEKANEDAKDSVPVSEKATSRDIEPVCDKGNKGDETMDKGEDATTQKVDEKIEETVKQVDEKKEEEKQVNEVENTDVQNQECVKDTEDTKTYQDVRKEDVPVKKQSFVKIVKQSFVKAKKAIIGKSQNPKTPASEPKDDGNK